MPMLKEFVDSGSRLVDYELLTDESGKRLVAFGKFAGFAGMINSLHGLGLQLLERGYRTPFLVLSICINLLIIRMLPLVIHTLH